MPSALHHSFALEVMSLTYGHDCTGTHHGMQLHTLLGVQAGDICIAFICIHEVVLKELCLCYYGTLSLGYGQYLRSLIDDVMYSY